jgi:hypothetical protein
MYRHSFLVLWLGRTQVASLSLIDVGSVTVTACVFLSTACRTYCVLASVVQGLLSRNV